MSGLLIRATEDGDRVAFIIEDTGEQATEHAREGFRRRAITAAIGRCPCGAVVAIPSRAERRRSVKAGRVLRTPVLHDTGCPAIAPDLR